MPNLDSLDCQEFKDKHDMATKALSERKLKEIEELAAGWGKLLAREDAIRRPPKRSWSGFTPPLTTHHSPLATHHSPLATHFPPAFRAKPM